MKNSIAYVVSKNKTIANSRSLNTTISYIVGISIFVFKKYWHRVFNLTEFNMSPTFKQFLQAKTDNAEKKQNILVTIIRHSG